MDDCELCGCSETVRVRDESDIYESMGSPVVCMNCAEGLDLSYVEIEHEEWR